MQYVVITAKKGIDSLNTSIEYLKMPFVCDELRFTATDYGG